MKTYFVKLHLVNGKELGTFTTATEEQIKDTLTYKVFESKIGDTIVLINCDNVLYTEINEIAPRDNIRKFNEVDSNDTSNDK